MMALYILFSVLGLVAYTGVSTLVYYWITEATGDDIISGMVCWMWPLSVPVFVSIRLTRRMMGRR